MTHTKEPWSLRDGMGDPAIKFITSKNDNHIAGVKREANARRIVACVNALAGIPIERIEALNQADGAKFVDVMLQWKDQRDELLEALKKAK